MATTHSTTARNAATDAVTALIGASGNIRFRTAGSIGALGTVVATFPLSATAFATSVNGTATANAISSDTNAVGNAAPVATATFETSGGTVHIHCAVATSGADISLTNGLVVGPGDRIDFDGPPLTYTALPG